MMGVCVYVCVPDIYQNTNKKRKKNQGTKFPISTPNAFCVSSADAPLRLKAFSKLERYKGADGEENSPVGPDTI